MSDDPQPSAALAEQPPITFHQQKSSLFRVVHSDGIWCSHSIYNQTHLIFFTERQAIPTKTFYAVDPEGNLGKEVVELRQGKDGWVRELEVDVVLSKKTAADLHAYLGTYLESMKNET